MSEQKTQAADPFAVLDQLRAINRADTRPRFKACPWLIGGQRLRLRRLQFEQLLAIKERLRAVDCRPGSDRAITAKQRAVLLHLVQISLVPSSGSGLQFPGHAGRSRIALLLEDHQIEGLGLALVAWNEVFEPEESESEKPNASTPSPIPADPPA